MEKIDLIDIEIKTGNIHRSFANHMIGAGDNKGDLIGMRILNNGQPANLSGASCIGWFIKPDGTTLVINGTVYGNTAYVELPEAAYAKEGQFTLAIKISGTGYAGTMRIVDGTVVRTTTNTINDPSGVVPSLESLMAVIERAEAAAEDIDDINITAIQIAGTRYKIAVTTS